MQLHRARDGFRSAGAELVLIGMGTSRQSTWFRGKYAPDLSVLSDPERVSYRAARLRTGSVAALMGPKSVASGLLHAARSGVVQGRPIGDVSQLGGALVVAPGGEVLLEERASDAGESVDPARLLEAVGRSR